MLFSQFCKSGEDNCNSFCCINKSYKVVEKENNFETDNNSCSLKRSFDCDLYDSTSNLSKRSNRRKSLSISNSHYSDDLFEPCQDLPNEDLQRKEKYKEIKELSVNQEDMILRLESNLMHNSVEEDASNQSNITKNNLTMSVQNTNKYSQKYNKSNPEEETLLIINSLDSNDYLENENREDLLYLIYLEKLRCFESGYLDFLVEMDKITKHFKKIKEYRLIEGMQSYEKIWQEMYSLKFNLFDEIPTQIIEKLGLLVEHDNNPLFFNLDILKACKDSKTMKFKKIFVDNNNLLIYILILAKYNNTKCLENTKNVILYVLNSGFMIFIDFFLPEFYNLRLYLIKRIKLDIQECYLNKIYLLLKILIKHSIRSTKLINCKFPDIALMQEKNYIYYESIDFFKETLHLRTIVAIICQESHLKNIDFFLRYINKYSLFFYIKDKHKKLDYINFWNLIGLIITFKEYDKLIPLEKENHVTVFHQILTLNSEYNLIYNKDFILIKNKYLLYVDLASIYKEQILNIFDGILLYLSNRKLLTKLEEEKNIHKVIKMMISKNINIVYLKISEYEKLINTKFN